MKETSFYQVRQDNALPLAELALLVRQAFITLYPGTSFDSDMTSLYGSENSFFLSRTGRTESIAVFVTPEVLDSESLAVISGKAADAENCVRKFRSQTQEFLVSITASAIPERLRLELNVTRPDWALFEYFLLQSEADEGLALKPVKEQKTYAPALPQPPVPQVRPAVPPSSPRMVPDRRLSSEELSALIDLSLGLEMRSRGMSWESESPSNPPKKGLTGSPKFESPRRRPDIDA